MTINRVGNIEICKQEVGQVAGVKFFIEARFTWEGKKIEFIDIDAYGEVHYRYVEGDRLYDYTEKLDLDETIKDSIIAHHRDEITDEYYEKLRDDDDQDYLRREFYSIAM